MTEVAKPLNIVFMGSPDFACPTLQALIDSTHNIIHVLTQPPRAAGRGMAEQKTPIAQLAERHDIPVSWPISLRDEDAKKQLEALNADLFVVVAYGLILPREVLAMPRLGAVNGHASLLPRWRGAAPIQRAIEAGDGETGTCAMMMEEGLDTGAVIHRQTTLINQEDTAATLHDRLADMTAQTLSEAIALLANGAAMPINQPEEGVTYAAKIQKAEAVLDLEKDAVSLKRHIHAFSPFPGAFIMGDSGKRFKCLTARIEKGHSTEKAGTYLGQSDDGGLRLSCGDGGVLTLLDVQPAGKKPMPAADYLRGKPLSIGQSLKEQI